MKRAILSGLALVVAAVAVALAAGDPAMDEDVIVTPSGQVVKIKKPRPASGAAASALASRPVTSKPVASKPAPKYNIKLGVNGSLGGRRCFPDDNPWNQDVSKAPIDPDSDKIITAIGKDKGFHPDMSFEWMVVAGDQAKVKIQAKNSGESEPGPYPIPDDAPIEGGNNSDGDRHVLVIDKDNWVLYELYASSFAGRGQGWKCDSSAVFNLNSNKLRPAGWTSADAAGLPIFPGLIRADEVLEQHEIRHALRFTVKKSRSAYIPPATHQAGRGDDPSLPPMGMRVRLKANVDLGKFPPQARVVAEALKKYGMILADNGSDWFISGAGDPHWDHNDLNHLKNLHGADLEVIRMDGLVTHGKH